MIGKLGLDEVIEDGNNFGNNEGTRNTKMVLIFADTKAEWLIRYHHYDLPSTYCVALVDRPRQFTIACTHRVPIVVKKLLPNLSKIMKEFF